MAVTDPASRALTRNVRKAIMEADVSYASVAERLGISRRTFYNRLDSGRFTITEIQKIANLTGTTLIGLLPDESKASA